MIGVKKLQFVDQTAYQDETVKHFDFSQNVCPLLSEKKKILSEQKQLGATIHQKVISDSRMSLKCEVDTSTCLPFIGIVLQV